MAWTQEKMTATYEKMEKLAATDAEFRKSLLADPNAAIAKLAGEDVPAGVKIKVVEQDPSYSATFLLPPLTSDEMSVDALDNVAGGSANPEEECGCVIRRG